MDISGFLKQTKKHQNHHFTPQTKQVTMEFNRNGAKFIPQVNKIILQYVNNSNFIYLFYLGVSQILLFCYAGRELQQNDKKSRLLKTR